MTDKNKLLETIIETVAIHQNVTPADIGNTQWQSARYGISRRCPANIAVAKQIVCYLAVKYPISYGILSVRLIGSAVGHKDFRNVRRYHKWTSNRMSVDRHFCDHVMTIDKDFLKNVMGVYSKFPVE